MRAHCSMAAALGDSSRCYTDVRLLCNIFGSHAWRELAIEFDQLSLYSCSLIRDLCGIVKALHATFCPLSCPVRKSQEVISACIFTLNLI